MQGCENSVGLFKLDNVKKVVKSNVAAKKWLWLRPNFSDNTLGGFVLPSLGLGTKFT